MTFVGFKLILFRVRASGTDMLVVTIAVTKNLQHLQTRACDSVKTRTNKDIFEMDKKHHHPRERGDAEHGIYQCTIRSSDLQIEDQEN